MFCFSSVDNGKEDDVDMRDAVLSVSHTSNKEYPHEVQEILLMKSWKAAWIEIRSNFLLRRNSQVTGISGGGVGKDWS